MSLVADQRQRLSSYCTGKRSLVKATGRQPAHDFSAAPKIAILRVKFSVHPGNPGTTEREDMMREGGYDEKARNRLGCSGFHAGIAGHYGECADPGAGSFEPPLAGAERNADP